ncbi:unnamed protein product [Ilex paraguariensis]|uniref:Glycosyltransferase N-terminal domain-containing protein n=1 Tax=Ilex paraguariensis TaxID=185542 RepID=A0ABC8RR57_9AQUA
MENHHGQNDRKEAHQIVVVMVPLPAQGHLNQLLHLSRHISSYGIPVHYVGTTTHSRQAKLRIHGWDPLAATNIHFHEFPTPSFLSPPPNPNVSFPSHILPLFYASLRLREPVGTLLRSLSTTTTRVVVIHDSVMASVVQDVPSIPNAESYSFVSISAFAISSFHRETGSPIPIEPEILKEAPSIESCVTSEQEIVTSLVVENAVKKLMASTEGDEIRKRAADLGGSIRQSVEDGGVTRMELDSFITHITR